jgi:hypothetical protein
MASVYLVYVDESGDIGSSSSSPTDWFVLNCIAVHESDWLSTLDLIVNLRRHLRDCYSLPPREELKGAHFRNSKGIFKGLGISRSKRMDIYQEIMNFESSLPIKTFSIAVHKQKAQSKGWNPRYCAWTFALQRLDTMSRKASERCCVFPDEGHGYFIRKRIRAMRRHHNVPTHYGPGSIQLPTSQLLEDPNDRRSGDSYFVQLADLNAYACHRSRYIQPVRRMSSTMWDNLKSHFGDVRLIDVNSIRGGPPGIVKYP